MRLTSLSTILIIGLASNASAQTIATWNINGGQQSPAELAENAQSFVDAEGPIDVLVLQEVIAEDQVEAIAEQIGYEHWAMSDFSPPLDITGVWYESLEVAILSNLPISEAVEWDATGRQPSGDGYPPRMPGDRVGREVIIPVTFQGTRPSRGFLRIDLENGWSVYGVHWKSSSGALCDAQDLGNAEQREDQAKAIALDLRRVLETSRTAVIAGDFNIQAPGTVLRAGTDPDEDCAPVDGVCEVACGVDGRDGYDDSISNLSNAADDFRLLSADLSRTYIDDRFADFAIDHIAVAGRDVEGFSEAVTPSAEGDLYFGSDHTPVIVSAR